MEALTVTRKEFMETHDLLELEMSCLDLIRSFGWTIVRITKKTDKTQEDTK